MQKPKVVDNATPALEFQDSSTQQALDGTVLRAKFQNDNFGNLFKMVENAGYSLIDNDTSQITKAMKGKYNATFTYNTSTISTQTVDDVVLGSNGVYYIVTADGVTGDDPVGSVTGKWEVHPTMNIKGGDFLKPNANVPLFTKATVTTLTIPIGFEVTIGDGSVKLESVYTLDLDADLDTGSKVAGTDYFIYAKIDETFYLSVDKTKTDGRLIGGFHYSLTPSAEALTGNKTEADMVKIRGINEHSFWDLKWRPVAEPEGMVYINGKWYDIYLLNSEHIINGTSKAGLTIAGGAVDANARAIPKIPLEYGGNGSVNYGAFKWFHATEIGQSHSKMLISYEEFMGIAYGVVEGTDSSIVGETIIGAVEHYPELTSKFGVEQATGTQYIWGSDLIGTTTGTFTWKDEAEQRGQIYSIGNSPNAVLLGGFRDDGVYAGSRCSYWAYYVWPSAWLIGCRFASDHLKLV